MILGILFLIGVAFGWILHDEFKGGKHDQV
jgi:hypothetical protein